MAELAVARQLARADGNREATRVRTTVTQAETEEAAKKNPPLDLPDDRRKAS
jgi:hypothetical protein